MKLVTVATRSERYFPFLLESCERHGAKLEVLGWGQKMGQHFTFYCDFSIWMAKV